MNIASTILKAMDDEWATLPLAEVVRKENIPGHVEYILVWEANDLQVLVRVAITSNGALRESIQIQDRYHHKPSLIASETKMHGGHFVNLYKMREEVRRGADRETVVRAAVEAALRTLQENPSKNASRLRRKEYQPIGGAVNLPFIIVQGGAPGLGKRA